MSSPPETSTGEVASVNGPLVGIRRLEALRLYDVVRIGDTGLIGEVIRLSERGALAQAYEDTAGLRVGDAVQSTGLPLRVELGPGLLGGVFDGIQRPLRPPSTSAEPQPYLEGRGDIAALDRTRLWALEPAVQPGDEVGGGDWLGRVLEGNLEHRLLCPIGVEGRVVRVAEGSTSVATPFVWIESGDQEAGLSMLQTWPVRRRRPCTERLEPHEPLLTGQRVIDLLFPLARGGSASIPGGFGTGKTVLEQSLARWAAADVILYVACGERGNEVTELLEEFADAASDLAQRIIFVVNTSNMPIAAREASIYTGITMAEYYRDQGYDVALLADSTSRWGEALREVSSRLEEMPGEEGYPAYLAARLAEFYERAGSVTALGAQRSRGSVSIVGAISPPGGDFSEPVTQSTLRLTGTFWALSTDLARARHFPAIDWTHSYSLYALDDWFCERVDEDWRELRRWTADLLQREAALMAIVQLLGSDTLAPAQRVVLHTGRTLREDYLQQSAFDPVDATCSPTKQYWMLRVIRTLHERLDLAVGSGALLEDLALTSELQEVSHMRQWPETTVEKRAKGLIEVLKVKVTTNREEG